MRMGDKMTVKLDQVLRDITGKDGKQADGTPFTARDGLLTLLNVHRPKDAKEAFALYAVAGKMHDEAVAGFDPTVKELDLLRAVAKTNANQQGQQLYAAYIQVQLMMLLGLGEEDV